MGRRPRACAIISRCSAQHRSGSSRYAANVEYFSGSYRSQSGASASSAVRSQGAPSSSTRTRPGTVSRNAGIPDSALIPAPVKTTSESTSGRDRSFAARSILSAATRAPPVHTGQSPRWSVRFPPAAAAARFDEDAATATLSATAPAKSVAVARSVSRSNRARAGTFAFAWEVSSMGSNRTASRTSAGRAVRET